MPEMFVTAERDRWTTLKNVRERHKDRGAIFTEHFYLGTSFRNSLNFIHLRLAVLMMQANIEVT